MSPDPLKAGPYLGPTLFYSHIMQSRGHETQAEKSGPMSLITLPKVFPGTPRGPTAKPFCCTFS